MKKKVIMDKVSVTNTPFIVLKGRRGNRIILIHKDAKKDTIELIKYLIK